ncbi:hypothetical protein JDV02_004078 [Purpureocillium takamizusanense]|uniref:DUF7730 domain-containing protein n=1 Tax=Purpureocillium takamizusanense TaxID=2060973 RepID=A0A9Q8QE09_9HYPO|nr:uncharacterized protein JDV02_004078 [Purpureocillium takamizusanense]UNI17758.1 hypothetical protein JDV02_004078 [Purpureocillium takamizusanense]
MISLREELGELFQGWPPLWAQCRRDGLLRSTPDLVAAVGATISLFVFILLIKAWELGKLAWSFANPRSPRHRERRERNRERASLSKLFLAAPERSVPLFAPAAATDSIDAHASTQSHATSPTKPPPPCLLFERVPPEVRRHILMLAFGDRTLHMDLSFRKRHNLITKRPYEGWGIHARIYDYLAPGGREAHLLPGEGKRWRWFGCVCHRFPSPEEEEAGPALLPLGRRRNNPWNHFREPDDDRCLEGAGECNKWPGQWPGKCQIGVLGWLLACRQAYAEGVEVIYKTNTIHIRSPILLRCIQDLVPRQRLSEMTSLELVWKPKQVALRQGFTGRKGSPPFKAPLFPSLRHLRISFHTLAYGEVDEATGLEWPYESAEVLSRALHERLFPEIDGLLERIAPPSAEVLVSCSKWEWYEVIDLYLLERQGEAKTRLQRADIEGLKCWRETPKATSDDADVESLERPATRRDGYWIHMCFEDVKLDSGMDYDWHRHRLYGLREGQRYRYPYYDS